MRLLLMPLLFLLLLLLLTLFLLLLLFYRRSFRRKTQWGATERRYRSSSRLLSPLCRFARVSKTRVPAAYRRCATQQTSTTTRRRRARRPQRGAAPLARGFQKGLSRRAVSSGRRPRRSSHPPRQPQRAPPPCERWTHASTSRQNVPPRVSSSPSSSSSSSPFPPTSPRSRRERIYVYVCLCLSLLCLVLSHSRSLLLSIAQRSLFPSFLIILPTFLSLFRLSLSSPHSTQHTVSECVNSYFSSISFSHSLFLVACCV